MVVHMGNTSHKEELINPLHSEAVIFFYCNEIETKSDINLPVASTLFGSDIFRTSST